MDVVPGVCRRSTVSDRLERRVHRGASLSRREGRGYFLRGLSRQRPDGGDSGPKLTGEVFLANWSSQSVAQLFDWVREAMPADTPGTLSKDDTAAVLAYILKLNKMPAGKQDLPTESGELIESRLSRTNRDRRAERFLSQHRVTKTQRYFFF